jgi:hypothetical protein
MTYKRLILALVLCCSVLPSYANFGTNYHGLNTTYPKDFIILGGTSGGGINANDPNLGAATAIGAQDNDIVVASCHCTQSTTAPATCAFSGPAGLTTPVNITSGVGRLNVAYYVVTSANKATALVCTNPGANTGGTVAEVIALRGVDPLNPTDATPTTATGSSTNPNPPSIVPGHDSSGVVVACSSLVSDTTPGDVTNYATATPGKQTFNQTDTQPGSGAITWRKVAVAASEDPVAFSSWTTGAWACATLALRRRGF